MSVGTFLKRRREQLGLTLRDVEKMTAGSVSNALLSQIETGAIAKPSFIVMHRLGAALGLSLEDIAKHLDDAPIPAPELCPSCGQMLRGPQ